MVKDFSEWQTTLQECKSVTRNHELRLKTIEDDIQPVNLDELQNKGQVSVQDIITVIKQVENELRHNTMSQHDYDMIDQRFEDVEKDLQKCQDQIAENREFRQNAEFIHDLPTKISQVKQLYKESHLEIESCERHVSVVTERLKQLEEMQAQANKI